MATFDEYFSNGAPDPTPVLVQTVGAEEQVVNVHASSASRRARTETMIFMHETIQMMQADRVRAIEALKEILQPNSIVHPLVKKADSVWEHITLGRDETCDVVVDDPAVSGVHANMILRDEAQEIEFQDVGSSNGTYLNREPIQPHTLCVVLPGDCIRVGQSVLYYIPHQAFRFLNGGSDQQE